MVWSRLPEAGRAGEAATLLQTFAPPARLRGPTAGSRAWYRPARGAAGTPYVGRATRCALPSRGRVRGRSDGPHGRTTDEDRVCRGTGSPVGGGSGFTGDRGRADCSHRVSDTVPPIATIWVRFSVGRIPRSTRRIRGRPRLWWVAACADRLRSRRSWTWGRRGSGTGRRRP